MYMRDGEAIFMKLHLILRGRFDEYVLRSFDVNQDISTSNNNNNRFKWMLLPLLLALNRQLSNT